MLQNIPRNKILDIVKQGPTFPAKIAKQLGAGGDTMLIGAILSTLISTGEVRVSSIKVGASPLYYVPDNESKLEDYIDHLNDKDRKVFKLLKEEKVLQDSEQDPLTRVSLRTIKDFAKSFEILHQGQKLLFWRFYDLHLNEAESLAKSIVKKISIEQPKPEHEIESRSESRQELRQEPRSEERRVELGHSVVAETRQAVEIHSERHAEAHAEVRDALEEHRSAVQDRPLVHVHEHEQKHEHAAHEQDDEHHEKLTKSKSHQPKTSKIPKVLKPQVSKVEYNFFELILNHVASMKLDVISKEKIKKSEYDLILKNHDTNEYIYCKAKDKSVVSESDLAPALIFAQHKRMPCLFMTTGELTKKAELMLGKELSALKFEKIMMNIDKQ
jgi:hypothetical protein